MRIYLLLPVLLLLASCNDEALQVPAVANDSTINMDTLQNAPQPATDTAKNALQSLPVNTDTVSRQTLVNYAKTLDSVPYKYASSDPAQGFDCSGFITYVFNHFDISVPRSSVDFTNVGKEVSLTAARTGDLILFTGTDSLIRIVGHMGIITENTDSLRFIHSTSGKADGVTITALNNYYMGRFVKVIDIFDK